MLNYGPAVLIVFSVFFGVLLNHRETANLKFDMNRQFDQVNGRLDKVEARLGRMDEDLRMFHGTDKELEGRINELSARVK